MSRHLNLVYSEILQRKLTGRYIGHKRKNNEADLQKATFAEIEMSA